MALPIRKPTRLQGYDYNRTGVYFITLCTVEKKKLLCNIYDNGISAAPHIEMTAAGRIVEKYICSTNKIPFLKVDKYVVMPNHVHLLLTVESGTSWAPSPTNAAIPRAVSTLKRLVNKELGGNIFQRSFHDHIVRNEEDYKRIWEYIDTNPCKWNLDVFYVE